MALNLSGGGGNDDIRVISGFNPQRDSTAFPVLLLNSRLDIKLDGEAGSDYLFTEVIPCIRPSGSLNITMDGGAGDDFVLATIFVDRMSTVNHNLSCRVNGGEGNDQVGLLALGQLGDPNLASFLIDGGPGIDTVIIALPNVRVRNCER